MNSKKNVIDALLIILLIFTLVSCKKDDGDDVSNAVEEFMTATYITSTATESFVADQDTNDFRNLTASKRNAGANVIFYGRNEHANRSFYTIEGTITEYTGVGSYTLDSSNSIAYMTMEFGHRTYSTFWPGISTSLIPGEIIITKDDGNILEGTFSFEALDHIGHLLSVSNGKFRVEYD